jgi:hypothetical protein
MMIDIDYVVRTSPELAVQVVSTINELHIMVFFRLSPDGLFPEWLDQESEVWIDHTGHLNSLLWHQLKYPIELAPGNVVENL